MIKPLRDYCVLRPLEAAGKIGAIWLPQTDSITEKNGTRCKVVAVGSECGRGKYWDVDVGDTVHLTAYGTHPAGITVMDGNEKLLMIQAKNINGVLT